MSTERKDLLNEEEIKHFEDCKERAVKGDAEAMFALAFCYLKGVWIVGEKEEVKEPLEFAKDKALELLEKAKEKGHLGAAITIAKSYHYGVFTEKNEEKAVDIYSSVIESKPDESSLNVVLDELEKLAWPEQYRALINKEAENKGNSKAQLELLLFYKSQADKFNRKVNLYKDLLVGQEKTHSEWFDIAIQKESEGNYKEAFDILDEIKDFFPEAQFNLARYYHEGIGTKVNKSKAVELYSVALKNKFYVAYPYLKELASDKEVSEFAKEILTEFMTEEIKNVYSIEKIYSKTVPYREMYNGLDEKKALTSFQGDAKKGSIEALFNLAYFYEKGIASEKPNLEHASLLYLIVLENSNGTYLSNQVINRLEAMSEQKDVGNVSGVYMATALYYGIGVEEDKELAKGYYQKSYTKDNDCKNIEKFTASIKRKLEANTKNVFSKEGEFAKYYHSYVLENPQISQQHIPQEQQEIKQ